jgi:hypothetical protein
MSHQLWRFTVQTWIIIALSVLLILSCVFSYKYYRLYMFEEGYVQRAERAYAPDPSVAVHGADFIHVPEPCERVRHYISYFMQDSPISSRIQSIWIDDTTIYHFAYELYHNRAKHQTDGVRFYLEEYDTTVNRYGGGQFHKGDINLALVCTRDSSCRHVDWYSDDFLKSLQKGQKSLVTTNSAPNIDNYNDPCPPSTTNCGSLDN